MTTWLMGISVALLLCLGAALWRVWRGPTDADRLMAAQLVGTGAVGVTLPLAAVTDWGALDMALVLVLLAGFVAVVFVKYVRFRASNNQGDNR